jgi:hypothetical protein
VVAFCVGVRLLAKGAVETREGPTAVEGLKNEPSSRVSKKSLVRN